jgi:molecular chaperone DnaK (HSP70)
VEYPDPNALPTSFTKTAEVLSIDYLTHLREHIIRVLKIKVGEGVIESTTIEYIITVPAIWSDAAKFRTRACAKRAGMGGDLQIISEPEAAVIYALDAMDPETLQAGDKFVLCDAGGGTVDLISYTIEELKPVVKISEAAAGTGAACGSTFLNRIFRKYLESTLSDNDGWDEDTLEGALDRFETIAKRKFNGDQEDIVIPVPGLTNDRSKGVMRGKLTMSASTLRGIFEPIITTITALVMAQIKATGDVKAVLLVGGFGQSPYLRESLRKVVGANIHVIQPAKGWTAVVRGALIKALAQASPEASRIMIGSGAARKAYGCRIHVPFDAAKHHQGRK